MTTTPMRYRWDDVPREDLSDVISRRMIWGEHLMLAQVHLRKGSTVPIHAHVNEQWSYVLQGSLELIVGPQRESFVINAGEVMHVPSNIPHEARALEDTLSLDVFSPPRSDWIDKTDDYLRSAPRR